MAIFKKKTKKDKVEIATAPEEPESQGEIEYAEQMNEEAPAPVSAPKPVPEPTPEYREIPVCMSQSQINNLVIENNIMLKQIISEMD